MTVWWVYIGLLEDTSECQQRGRHECCIGNALHFLAVVPKPLLSFFSHGVRKLASSSQSSFPASCGPNP